MIKTKLISFILLLLICIQSFIIPVYAAETEDKETVTIETMETKISENFQKETLLESPKQLSNYLSSSMELINLYVEKFNAVNTEISTATTTMVLNQNAVVRLSKKISDISESITNLDNEIIKEASKIFKKYNSLYFHWKGKVPETRSEYMTLLGESLTLPLVKRALETDQIFKKDIDNYDVLINNTKTETKKISEQLDNIKKHLPKYNEEIKTAAAKVEEKTVIINEIKEKINKLFDYNTELFNLDIYDTLSYWFVIRDFKIAFTELCNENEEFLEYVENPYEEDIQYLLIPINFDDVCMTSDYGYRTLNGIYSFHRGIDICRISGTYGCEISAAEDGTVIVASYDYSYGYYVIIEHAEGFSTVYAHCSQLNVYVGQEVSKGDVIAYGGSTGYSTGPHLHFEVRYNGSKENPELFFETDIPWTP